MCQDVKNSSVKTGFFLLLSSGSLECLILIGQSHHPEVWYFLMFPIAHCNAVYKPLIQVTETGATLNNAAIDLPQKSDVGSGKGVSPN